MSPRRDSGVMSHTLHVTPRLSVNSRSVIALRPSVAPPARQHWRVHDARVTGQVIFLPQGEDDAMRSHVKVEFDRQRRRRLRPPAARLTRNADDVMHEDEGPLLAAPLRLDLPHVL